MRSRKKVAVGAVVVAVVVAEADPAKTEMAKRPKLQTTRIGKAAGVAEADAEVMTATDSRSSTSRSHSVEVADSVVTTRMGTKKASSTRAAVVDRTSDQAWYTRTRASALMQTLRCKRERLVRTLGCKSKCPM